MANRFLDTNFYKSPYVRGLKGPLKALYGFIICDCTPCGFWAKDLEIAGLYIGFNVSEDEFIENFVLRGKAVELGGGKYFFPDFIEHQYPSGLQGWNKAHNKIILELEKHDFLTSTQAEKGLLYFIKKKGPSKGLESSQGLGQGNGNGNGQGNDEPPPDKFLVPAMLAVYKKANPNHPDSIEKDYKPLQDISLFIHKQQKLNGNHVQNKSIIIKQWEQLCSVISDDKFYKTKTLSVISNQIQEIYQIQKNGKSNNSTAKISSVGRSLDFDSA